MTFYRKIWKWRFIFSF